MLFLSDCPEELYLTKEEVSLDCFALRSELVLGEQRVDHMPVDPCPGLIGNTLQSFGLRSQAIFRDRQTVASCSLEEENTRVHSAPIAQIRMKAMSGACALNEQHGTARRGEMSLAGRLKDPA